MNRVIGYLRCRGIFAPNRIIREKSCRVIAAGDDIVVQVNNWLPPSR